VISFLADRNLGKLCRLLRSMGVDCKYVNTSVPEELIQIAEKEKRIILTRRRNFPTGTHEFFVVVDDIPFNQAVEVVKKFKIDPLENAFTRCLNCNVELKQISPEEVRGKVPSYISKKHKEFKMCPSCGKIYWRGTHQKNMLKILMEIRKSASES